MRLINTFPFESLIWLSGLIVLAFWNFSTDTHFTLCPLANLGFDFCPGCGLGKSISLFFKGEVKESLYTHPFGIFAVIILSLRIFQQTKNYLKLWPK
jgi:hypothetical protein